MRFLIFGVIIFAVLVWLGYDTQSAIEQCKAAGIQSNATCEAYAR